MTELIASAEEDGGNIILEGRNITPPELYPSGNFVGPTIIHGGTSMKCYQYVFETFYMKSGRSFCLDKKSLAQF